jgi:hypothetical protein
LFLQKKWIDGVGNVNRRNDENMEWNVCW